MHPEIVSGVNFIFTSKIYSNISYRSIDEEVDGITMMTVNILHWNCSLRPEKQPKMSPGRFLQRPGSGATGRISPTNLNCYLITLIRV